MKKLLLLAFIAFTVNLNSQTVLFEDSFETYNDFIITNIGDWITIDLDGSGTYSGGGGTFANQFDPKAFMVFNPATAGVTNATTGTEVRNFDPHSGAKYAGCWAATDSANNDWLVSPAIELGATGNELKFWVKSMSSSYGLETYRVGVYIGNGTPTSGSDFTIISGAANLIAPYPNWEEKTFSLDDYAGETIRIGILCNSDDRYFFMVDDFSVTAQTMSVQDFFANNMKIYPNPAKDVINLSTSTTLINSVQVSDLNGRMVKSFHLNGLSQTELNVADLQSGIYFLSVDTDLGTGTVKIVKE